MSFLSKGWKKSVLFSPFGGRKPITANRSKLIPASAVLKDRYFGRIPWVPRPRRGAAEGDGPSGPKGGSYQERQFHFTITTFVVGAVYYVYNDWSNSQYHKAVLDKQVDMICELKRNGEYLKKLVDLRTSAPPAPPAPRAPTSLARMLCFTRRT